MPRTEATFFIVDDDPSVRKSLLRLIRSGGWHAESFASAEEFLACASFSGIGCLILDVHMPGMMGPELCKMMAVRNIALPVIFLSGHADISADEARNLGAVNVLDVLEKPVDAKTLIQAIRLALERHAAAKNDRH